MADIPDLIDGDRRLVRVVTVVRDGNVTHVRVVWEPCDMQRIPQNPLDLWSFNPLGSDL